MTSIDERTLIDSAIQGSADAFSELVRLHQNRLFRAMLHVVGCPAEAEDVVQALAQLPESERAILILREFEEFDYTTILDMLGLKVGTVRSRLHRARSHLLEKLKRLGCGTELQSRGRPSTLA